MYKKDSINGDCLCFPSLTQGLFQSAEKKLSVGWSGPIEPAGNPVLQLENQVSVCSFRKLHLTRTNNQHYVALADFALLCFRSAGLPLGNLHYRQRRNSLTSILTRPSHLTTSALRNKSLQRNSGENRLHPIVVPSGASFQSIALTECATWRDDVDEFNVPASKYQKNCETHFAKLRKIFIL